MTGLEKGKVYLAPHSHEWDVLAAIKTAKLRNILGENAVSIEHIGSTAVRSIKAKPIIDIMAAMNNIDDVKRFIPYLEKAGFYYIPNNGTKGQYLFGCGSFYDKTGNEQTCFVHVVKAHSVDHNNYVNFRDYLNAFPATAEKYEKLKESLSHEFPSDRQSYTNGKKEFINHIIRKATVWSYLGKKVKIAIDRPIGYVHEKEHYSLTYPINYGYIPGVPGGDGEDLDVYLLGVDEPVSEYECRIIGIAHRKDDVEDKLIGCPDGMTFNQAEIAEQIEFQEKYYKTSIEAVSQLSCGAIVYRERDGEREYLLLHQKRSGRWGFPKGHKEAHETDVQTAEREIFEETGLRAVVDTSFCTEIHYAVNSKSSKTVRLFAANADGEVNVCRDEIIGYEWVTEKRAKELLPPDTSEAFDRL